MVFSVSPSVTVREVDLTATIPNPSTPPAAIAGVFAWGPINERVLITSEAELANTFGKPSDLNAETFFVAADFLTYSSALYVTRVVGDTAAVATSDLFEAKYPGVLGNSVGVSYITSGGSTSAFEEQIFNISEIIDAVITFSSNSIIIETTQDIAESSLPKTGDILVIGNSTVGYQELFVSAASVFDDGANTAVYTHSLSFTKNYTLPEEDFENLEFSRKWGYGNLVNGAPQANTMHIVVTDTNGNVSGTRGQVLEVYENLSSSPSSKLPDGTNNYYKDVLAERSKWIVASDSTANTSVSTRDYVTLSGGIDGAGESSIPFAKIALGYDLYREATEIDIAFILQGKAINPGGSFTPTSANLANYLIANIAEVRRDCVVFVSAPKEAIVNVANPSSQLNNLLDYRGALQSSSYWFMDSGYKYRYDKYNDVYRWVPLNGDIAGLASRVEPWESPAGYRKGIIRNVVKLAFNPTKAQRDILYGRDVNPVITQVGQGTLLFGDKTGLGSATGSAFTRLNVRRLFITVEKTIATISASFLFEFNDEFIQTQFSNIVNPFLRDIQGRRGIIDFRVVSDGTVNTPDVIDTNTFRANIFIKPARSINFIELTFIATRTGTSFEELVGIPL